MRLIALTLALFPLPAFADDVIDRFIDLALPKVDSFAAASTGLADVAAADCASDPDRVKAAWHDTADAWLDVQNLRLGPLEDGSRRASIAFWPDVDGHRHRALSRILSGPALIDTVTATFAEQPVSAKGIYAAEALLFDPAYAMGANCMLLTAVTRDLAATAVAVQTDWHDTFASQLQTAGDADNARYLDVAEAHQAIFTALLTSLQFDIDERLGLPLGSFDRPRPNRAESILSGRSQRNLDQSLASHADLIKALVPDVQDAPTTYDGLTRVQARIAALDDPDLSGVSDPQERFNIEALHTSLSALHTAIQTELGTALGVTIGLNSLDGD